MKKRSSQTAPQSNAAPLDARRFHALTIELYELFSLAINGENAQLRDSLATFKPHAGWVGEAFDYLDGMRFIAERMLVHVVTEEVISKMQTHK